MGFGKLRKPVIYFSVLIAISMALAIFLVATGAAAPPAGDEEFGTVADASNAFLNSNPLIYINASELMATLDDNNDGVIDSSDNPSNDPLVIDVRSNADYQTMGHIPGAINIAYKDMVKPANLAIIRSELAKHNNKTIVLACYTGHTDKLSEMALGSVAQAGYFGTPAPNVLALKWGNLGWNTDSERAAGHVPVYTNTFGMETTAHALPAPSSYPVVNNTDSTETAEITRVADDLSLYTSGGGYPWAVPGTGAGQINDTNISSYTVIDVRSATDYAAGHIPGAFNISYQQLFAQDGSGDYVNLLSVDRSKPIIVYDNGQQEGNAAMVGMNALGIRNASVPTRSIRFGLANWNFNYGTMFVDSVAGDQRSYPDVTGAAPGGLTYAASCLGGIPSLSLSAPTPNWASYADYTARLLSVNWKTSNVGSNIAYDVKLTGSSNSNGVSLATAIPVTVANIMSPAGSASVTLKYNVPVGVGSWHTATAGSATDICGNSYTLP
ncbi:MAG: rhodanese-like domain-containing protein [Thermoleophilia bacterium]